MSLFGAILGDIAGSCLEFSGNLDPSVRLWTREDFFTDDTVLTVAHAEALLLPYSAPESQREDEYKNQLTRCYREYGRMYPHAGYGKRFRHWLKTNEPYVSFGNGSIMRVSPAAWAAGTLDDAVRLAHLSCWPTHTHPDSIGCAGMVAGAIYNARIGMAKDSILSPGTTVAELRKRGRYTESVIPTMSAAIASVYEADDFEGAIRNAVSVGGDADTIAAVAGSLAAPLYGIPSKLVDFARRKLDRQLLTVIDEFHKRYNVPVLGTEKEVA